MESAKFRHLFSPLVLSTASLLCDRKDYISVKLEKEEVRGLAGFLQGRGGQVTRQKKKKNQNPKNIKTIEAAILTSTFGLLFRDYSLNVWSICQEQLVFFLSLQ